VFVGVVTIEIVAAPVVVAIQITDVVVFVLSNWPTAP